MSESFHLELDLETAIELHLALGEEDGGLYALRRGLRDYLYGQLSIEELEALRSSRRAEAGAPGLTAGQKGFP